MIRIRRIYNSGEKGNDYKVYVDRLWPRGISKEKAGWNEWMKDISPGENLRKWFNHEPDKWEEFKSLYKKELLQKQDMLQRLKKLEKEYGTLTLLYSSKEEKFNNAAALREMLDQTKTQTHI